MAMTASAQSFFAAALAAAFSFSAALAHPHGNDGDSSHDHASGWVHENGIGPDPDRDTNPATITSVIPFIADPVEAANDPPYAVITFEPPPGKHGEAIRLDYEKTYGVKFGPGLSWQICKGQRHFQYDSMCTYAAPTSGQFAAGYQNDSNKPLVIEFDKPVCIVTMSIYPTGGWEGEPFEFTIEGWTETGHRLSTATAEFEWTNNTVRWRNMAGVYFVDQRASKITISMRSIHGRKKQKGTHHLVRYLIDDFAFVNDGCEAALEDIVERTGIQFDIYPELISEEDSELEEAVDSLEVSGS